MTLDVEWSGQAEFNSQELREWSYNGTVAGKTRSAGNLSFITVYGGGHMVWATDDMRGLILSDHPLA